MSTAPSTLKRTRTKPPATLTVDECTRLLIQVGLSENSTHKTFCRDRNVLMFLCMLDAGLRVGEVVQMKVASFVFADSVATALNVPAAIAKGNSERTIPLSDRLRAAIILMMKWWISPGLSIHNKYAFCPRRGGNIITCRQVQRIIFNAGKKAIGRKVHPHELRHTFATRLMRTTNSRVVQQLLGHKQLTSTQIYTHPNGDDLLAAIKTLNS